MLLNLGLLLADFAAVVVFCCHAAFATAAALQATAAELLDLLRGAADAATVPNQV